MYHFNNIDGNLTGTFNIQDTLVSKLKPGTNCSPALAFLNNDTIPDLIVGNERGGVSIYMGTGDNSIGIEEINQFNAVIYPNPSSDFINVRSSYVIDFIEIFDASGRIVWNGPYSPNINISSLVSGVFIIKLSSNKDAIYHKFIKQ